MIFFCSLIILNFLENIILATDTKVVLCEVIRMALNILKIFSRHMKQEVELSLASSKWMTHVNKATYTF